MLRSWAAHTYPKFMRVLRWGIDLAQLYTNGGTGMCIGLQSSLEGNGVATSNSGPFEKFGGCGAGGGGGGGVGCLGFESKILGILFKMV